MGLRSKLQWLLPGWMVDSAIDIYFKYKAWKWRTSDDSGIPGIENLHPDKLDNLIVVGNGPSFNDTYAKYKEVLKKTDLICVNSFCDSELFTELKPKYYIIAEPAYYDDEHLSQYLRFEEYQSNINSLVNKTSWEMIFFVPSYGRKSSLVRSIKKNPNIKIYQYSNDAFNADIYHGKRLPAYFRKLDLNRAFVPQQTVLNAALMLGIFLRYANIFLVGADNSFIKDIDVDQTTNMLISKFGHFMDSGKTEDEIEKQNELSSRGANTHNGLENWNGAFVKMLQGYKVAVQYAEYAGVNVYNASEYSLIDCIGRRTLDDLK